MVLYIVFKGAYKFYEKIAHIALIRGMLSHCTFVCFTTGIWKKTPGDVVR